MDKNTLVVVLTVVYDVFDLYEGKGKEQEAIGLVIDRVVHLLKES